MSGPSSAASAPSIPLARPALSDQARAKVLDVLGSGRLSRGPYLEQFEARMADRCGTEHAVGVSSGTAALHCIVAALDLKPGAEVLTTPFSFVASTNVLLYEDLTPRFVDVDPATYNLDVCRVADAITPRTEAILAVDVFGRPADWPALTDLAEAHDLRLIDDACEALGGQVGGRPVGSWGDAAGFGFYPNKQITTGEGGCITTDAPALARACRSLRNQGRSPQSSGRMRHDRLGHNYRLDELSAALGCAQLDRLDDLLDRRRAVAAMYEEALASLRDDLRLPAPSPRRSWFVYVVRLRDHFASGARDELMAALRAEGVECAPYFPAIHLQPYHRETLGHAPGDFPVCERMSARTLALPFHGGLSRDTVDRVARVLKKRLSSLSQQTISQ
ncbi:MAG: DegT/DnrJ/EryC1/StrS family aminotransferase [Salinibacter sp.]